MVLNLLHLELGNRPNVAVLVLYLSRIVVHIMGRRRFVTTSFQRAGVGVCVNVNMNQCNFELYPMASIRDYRKCAVATKHRVALHSHNHFASLFLRSRKRCTVYTVHCKFQVQ